MKMLILTASVLTLAACGSLRDEPIIDTRGVNLSQYEDDLADCETFADQVRGGQKIVGGAAAGAVFGGVIGAVAGNRRSAERAAGVGAVVGGARGAGDTARDREQVVRRCLIGRGYRVLN